MKVYVDINAITHQSIEAGYVRYEDTSGRDKGDSRIENGTSKVLSSVMRTVQPKL
jgi:hypothetical protein